MKLTIKLDIDNAAFEDGGPAEVARILSALVEQLPEPLRPTPGALTLRDFNGNDVGYASIE